MRYQVWYMKPEFFGNGITGQQLPDASNLAATHVHLKDIDSDGIEKAWHAMQAENWSPNGEARELIKAKGLQHTSMSVGDVIVDDVGNAHVALMIGFKAIGGVTALWKRRAIVATRGTQLGAIICAVFGEKIEAPCFHGKAIITSDGFVQANFTGADGRQHSMAFVGSASDLVRNTIGLAAHLKLNDAEKAELFTAIRDWIGTDYSNGALKVLEVA